MLCRFCPFNPFFIRIPLLKACMGGSYNYAVGTPPIASRPSSSRSMRWLPLKLTRS